MENNNFDFTKEPGNIKKFAKFSHRKVDISIVTAYFNASNYIFQTAYSVLSQTFPNWEWIIVNDGSTELETKKVLSKLEKLDTRIRILNQNNSGPAVARDYGIKNSIGDFVLILDADDLIDKTFLECAYWSLLSNPDASWSYSDQVGFGSKEYLWTQKFDVQKQKSENLLCICSLIKKTALITSGGYSYTKNSFHEDWKLWLQMLSKNYFPVKMNFFRFLV